MQSFIREAVYDDFYSSTMAQARALKWRSQKSKSFCRLPPDQDALNHHIERANYLSYLFKHMHMEQRPSPIGKGFEQIDNVIRPLRYSKAPLPESLTVPETAQIMTSEEKSESDDDFDIDNNSESYEYNDIDLTTDNEDF